jgi:Mg-chelatase subunit ChlD
MTKKKLYAHVLLDRSGSMESCRDSTISAFNEYVGGLAGDDAVSARVSLTIFDSNSIDLIHDNIKAKELPKLTREVFVPRGSTPLNDAIGKTVAKIDGETRREGENVAFVILTDGMENASTEYTKDAIKKLLDGRQADKNWLVIYLGANQDAFAEGAARGTVAMNTMNFAPTAMSATMKAATRATMSYAASGSRASAAFTDEERKKARL